MSSGPTAAGGQVLPGLQGVLAHDLVDELHLILGAAVVGAGTPIFGAKPPGRLRLAEVRRFDGSDNLVMRYQLGPDAG